MNKILTILVALMSLTTLSTRAAEGWPAQYGGVMLQGFYWDSYTDTQWSYLESQSDELARYFSLIWVPQSGYCNGGNNMGYTPVYYFRQDSSFGSETQLRSMINAYKQKGTGIIADVVINHRNNLGQNGSWVDYPKETYKGTDYQMLPTDICSNDDGGKTRTWASNNGISISSNTDTGEDWDGCRDIDHKSPNVNRCVKAYLSYLLNDLGYAGFRYDMVKGYSASYTADYNSASNPTYSVGEYWDGNASAVQRWMEGTKKDGVIQSGAFDFSFRYTCRDAVNNNSWSRLTGTTSVTNPTYNRYSITFVENHDTEYRSASAQQDPIRRDTLACNAWLLANPGTPCVFYKHWQKYKHELKLMIEARRLVGITNQSTTANMGSSSAYCARRIEGSNGQLIVVVGNGCTNYTMPEGYRELLSGYHYRYLVSTDCDTKNWAATVARIEAEDKMEDFTPHTATVYVKVNFSPLYFYAWDAKTQLNGSWPGKQIDNNTAASTTINGERWYFQTFDINDPNYEFNIIFNQGNGKPQTVDIGHISSDRYFVATLSGGKVDYEDVTRSVGINAITTPASGSTPMYNLQGIQTPQRGTLPHGIYIRNGQKIIR